MTSTRPVVLGVDRAYPAPLRFALAEARRREAPLRIVHGAAMPFEQMELAMSDATYRELMSAGQALLDDVRGVVEQTAPAVDAEYLLSSRAPVDLLIEEARSAQLLVIGVDDVPWVDRLVGGAVARHLAQHASCALVAVPKSSDDDPHRAGVVVAVDGNSAARPLLRMAFDVAQDRECSLRALSVVPIGAQPPAVETVRAALGEVLAGWRELYPDVEIVQDVVAGDPDAACVAATREAELVVVGRSRRHGFRRTIAAAVVRHASGPVGVVPLEDADA